MKSKGATKRKEKRKKKQHYAAKDKEETPQ